MDQRINSVAQSLQADGERFLPDQMHGSIELEHLHRYRFASQLVADKVVLDIASGEGYGSAYLAGFARRVIGVDIAKDAVDHANQKYSKSNLEYLVGSCSAIPLEDGAIDIVVSFETLEHHDEHEAMMREIKRVLRPGGILIISSPDRLEYSEKPSFHNPFHVKELYLEEFQSLLAAHFGNVKLYGQRVMLGSALFSQGVEKKIVFQELGNESAPSSDIPKPLYWVAVASDKKLPSTSGGILEQSLGNLWQDITSQRNTKNLELIEAVAAPDSNLLKAQLRSSWYLQQNPDIVAAGVDPYEHWVNNGITEGRLPASDLVVLARDLASEREQSLRVVIEERELELRHIQHKALERQRELEAEIVQTKFNAQDEVNTHLRTLAERERTFAEQLSASVEQHTQREQSLRVVIEERELELRQIQHKALERQRELEAEIVQTKFNAQDEVNTHLHTLAERERAFAEQLSASVDQHAQREQSLRVAIEEKEHELRQAQHKALERQRELEAEIVQTKLKAQNKINGHLRMQAERERNFSEQLFQLQQVANKERASLKDQYTSLLFDLNKKLVSIQTTWSWRLTAPLRSFSVFFKTGSDFGRIAPHQLSSVLFPEEKGTVPIGTKTDVSWYHVTPGVDKENQEIPSAILSSTAIASVNTLEELLAYDDEFFVTCAYLTLLGRAPDPQGFNYYTGRLKEYGDKLAIIYQIYRGQEAKRFSNNIAGLTAAMRRQKWKQTPILGSWIGAFNRKSKSAIDRRIEATDTNQKESPVAKVNQAQRIGAKLYVPQASIQSAPTVATTGTSKGITSYFIQPADEILQDDGYTFTRLMHYIWSSRLDLQSVFDIYKHDGRFEFCKWFLASGSNEYGLTPNVYPKNLLEKLVLVGGDVGWKAQDMLVAQTSIGYEIKRDQVMPSADSADAGANLIGYAFGEFGMGEHVRMVARSLNKSNSLFCIIDQDVGLHGAEDDSVGHWVTDTPQYSTNIFHVNADVFPPLYFKFGEAFFSGHHNIGYWAWELSKCPREFDVALNMVDEVWAISDFVAESFKIRSPVPVITMPLAVSVPDLAPIYTKSYYELPEDAFVFYFTFDAASYLDRKNPLAVIRAFRLAFPSENQSVHLLLKTMNVEGTGLLWKILLEEIGNDPRITIMSKTMAREEVLGLNMACDAFVSLHRSEGFGRCVAEAMAYGKPVIATNYSGTRDFAMEGTACVVDYRLVPVPEGAYPFCEDQVWAEPDIEHAASLMKKLVSDDAYRGEIASAGQKFVKENFNESVIGERYAKRLDEIRLQRSLCFVQPEPVQTSSSSINGMVACLMQPANEIPQDGCYTFTRLMHYIWSSRLDLQNVFDIYQHDGRLEFCKWLLCNGANEYGLTPDIYSKDLLEKLVSVGGSVGERAKETLDVLSSVRNQVLVNQAVRHAHIDAVGANLIGYAFGEFGLGEHVRMMARSFNTTDTSFCIIRQDIEMHGAGDRSVSHWVVDTPQYDTNIFSINADVFPFLYFRLGEAFFSGRYNIGSWAWELSKCPPEFDVALSMVNEVWSISEFVTESIKSRSFVPVITMPHAVTVPELDTCHYTKAHYGLPVDKFVFYFTFDSASYLDRKNPVAVVRAFKLAFPATNENAHLLLKTMNTEVAGGMWLALLKEIDADPRITIMSKKLTREEALGLNLACDAFVSLHRSEGFGFCVAEAMAYGKPVIATNYSGTRDFAMEGTACVVDYRLVPVPEGAYPFCEDQVWAEPDIEHAASLMKKLVSDDAYRGEIASAGQKFVKENFNESVIGRRYVKRLEEINAMRLCRPPKKMQDAFHSQLPISGIDKLTASIVTHNHEAHLQSDDIAGNIDAPTIEQCKEISDVISVEGWIVSARGIECIEIYIDSTFVGQAYYGVLRPDIHNAFPLIANAGRSGFCYLVNPVGHAKGSHVLRVVAKSRNGAEKEWRMNFTLTASTRYQKWLEKNEQVYGKGKLQINIEAKNFYSLLLKIESKSDRSLLMQTFESLAAQTYAKFEIVIIADSSQYPMIVNLVEEAGLSSKTRFTTNSLTDWMSNVDACRGHLVGLMDGGDVLRPWALNEVDNVIRTTKNVSLVYADEDTLHEGGRCNPIFKPCWSPVFLDNYNYIGRPWFALKSDLVSTLFGLDLAGMLVNEHLLLKRIGDISSSVCHIPSVLLSRNNYSIESQQKNYVSKKLPGNRAEMMYPKVSIIIPTRLSDIALVERCFLGLCNSTDYPNMEVIIVINNVSDSSLVENYLSKWPFKVIHWRDAFSWSGINNFGAVHATGDYLLFMNDDIEPIEGDWLKIMMQTLISTEAAVVGPLLKYPNGTIQHLGINFVDCGSGVRHLFRFCTGTEERLQWLMNYPREVSAVTGACLLTSKKHFDAVGGFDESLPLVCNDTDFCIRLSQNECSIIIQPEAKLIHHEGVSRAGMPEVDDVDRFWRKWKELLECGDRFTNPNLDATRDDWIVSPDSRTRYNHRIVNRIVERMRS